MWISLHMNTYKLLGQEAERQFTRAEDIDLYFSGRPKFQEQISSSWNPTNIYLSPSRNGGILGCQLTLQRCHLLPSPCLAQAQGKSNIIQTFQRSTEANLFNGLLPLKSLFTIYCFPEMEVRVR